MATVQKNIPRSLIRLLNKFQEHRDKAHERAKIITYEAIRASVRKRAYKTGFFHDSIQSRSRKFVSFDTTEFYSECLYAGFLERGTRYMKARRPFSLGLMEAKAAIEREYQAEFTLFRRSLNT